MNIKWLESSDIYLKAKDLLNTYEKNSKNLTGEVPLEEIAEFELDLILDYDRP